MNLGRSGLLITLKSGKMYRKDLFLAEKYWKCMKKEGLSLLHWYVDVPLCSRIRIALIKVLIFRYKYAFNRSETCAVMPKFASFPFHPQKNLFPQLSIPLPPTKSPNFSFSKHLSPKCRQSSVSFRLSQLFVILSMTSSFDRSLYVQTKTWVRDSHDLFDYESDHVQSTAFEASVSGQLQRIDNLVRLTSLAEGDGERQPLLTLHREEGRD